MGLFKFKKTLLGLTTVLAAASLFADTLDTHDDGINANDFEQYWYYYDDNTGAGADDRPLAASGTAFSEILVPCTLKSRQFEGNTADVFKVKDYSFVVETDPGTGNKFATCPFKMGEEWASTLGTWNLSSYCGIGTMLAAEGERIDLSAATGFKFDIRVRQNDLKVKFKVQQLGIEKDSTFGFYEFEVATVAGEWKTVTVLMDEFTQPPWAQAPDPRERNFALDSITKIGWHIEGQLDPGAIDTLDIDNVEVLNYTFVSPKIWNSTVPLADSLSAGRFATFEGANPQYAPATKTYWYAYNDADIGGNSVVSIGAVENDSTKRLSLQFEAGSGSDGVGNAAKLRYTIGDSVMQGATEVKGFVGIGVNLYDSAHCKYFDAQTRGISSLFFHYMAEGDLDFITLEVCDMYDVADSANQTRKDSRGSGIVHFRNLPNTLGQWVAVEIPFSELVEETKWIGYTAIPLDLTKLAKLQFKAQGPKDKGGIIGIDNVYFDAPVPVHKKALSSSVSPFAASYRNGNISVNFAGSVTDGKISVVNARGSVVKSIAINKANKVSEKFSAKNLAAGVYFVKVNAVDVHGKSVVMQSSINVVK